MTNFKGLIAGISLCLVAGGATAQGYPEKDVTLIVPWSAGGGTDSIARSLVSQAEECFGAVVLHRSAATRNAPFPRWNSGGAFKTWAAKSSHSV